MSQPPQSELIALLFADVEGSGEGLQRYGGAFRDSLRRLQDIAHAAVDRCGGYYANHTGDGFLLAFPTTIAAARCACDVQRTLLGDNWDPGLPRLRVRLGIHTGPVEMYRDQYEGPTVWRAARVMKAAHGTQALLSDAAYEEIRGQLSELSGATVQELGTYRLRELASPALLARLEIEGCAQSTAPPRALSANATDSGSDESRFIGRKKELSDILRSFRQHRTRLVTITGIGGLGKSRLATRAAVELVDDYPDGVWFIEFDALRERDDIAAAIYHALGEPVGAAPADRALHHTLKSRRILLVLDCFERLCDHADVVQGILDAAPGVAFLVTSRRTLGLPGEYVYPLQPMASDAVDASRGDMSDSIRLFLDAASRVDHELGAIPGSEPLAQELCDLLEGIPLSIVLAARWLRYLSLAELVSHVRENRLQVLAHGENAPEAGRHSDLRRVIEDSFSMLPADGQSLLRELQLFVGGFYLEDAQAVCGEKARLPMLQKIARLVDNSFVHKNARDSRTRYRLFDTVREYLEETTPETGQLAQRRLRHAEHYAEIAEQMNAQSRDGKWSESSGGLWRELGNFRTAIAHGEAIGDARLLVRFADSLARPYFEAGLWSDFDTLARSAEVSARRLGRSDSLANLYGLRGAHALRQGNYGEAERFWKQRLALAQEIDDAAACADCLCDLAQIANQNGDLAAAQDWIEEAIKITEERPVSSLLAHLRQSEVRLARGDVSAAIEHAALARQQLNPEKDLDLAIYVELTLGRARREAGEHDAAERALAEMLRLANQGGRRFGVGRALLELGQLYERDGRTVCAAGAYLAAEKVHAALPSQRQEAARAEFRRFRNENDRSEVHAFLHEASKRSWEELVSQLLSALPPSRSAPVPFAAGE